MHNEVYSKLRRHLDTFVLGAPEADSILEILRIRFTPEEAETALILRQLPEELGALANSSGRSQEDLRTILEQMADKALVLKVTNTVDGVTKELYALLPTAVGLMESSFATGERTPRTQQLARYWREYYNSGWGERMNSAKIPFGRVLPIEQSVTAQQEIYSYEKASTLIKEHDYACVVHCACRTAADLDGKGCGKPTEVCLHFGDLARFFVERGYARAVSQEEVLAILDKTERAGLVHMVSNTKEMGVAMCSCCTCCCSVLRAIAEMPNPDAIAKSRFTAELDMDKCIFCDVCLDRCWIGAISFTDGVGTVDRNKCYGCGLCVTECPPEAIALKPKEGYQEPVAAADFASVFLGETH